VTIEPIYEQVYGENYQDPGLIRRPTSRLDYRLSVKKDALQQSVITNLNKQTTGLWISIRENSSTKTR